MKRTYILILAAIAIDISAQSAYAQKWRSFAIDTISTAGWAQPSSPDMLSHSLLVDRNGNVWLAYGPYGLLRYDGQSWKFLDTSEGFLNDTINTMTCDTAGNVWFAGKGAIYKYDGTWHTYSISDALKGFRNFQAIACDSNNTIWTASLSWIFTGRYISGIPVDSLVAEIFTFDGSNWKPYNISVADPGGWQGVQAIACSKESVWCVAWQPYDSSDNYSGGLYRFNGSGWDSFDLNTGVSGNYPRDPTDVCIDKNGVVWITSTAVAEPFVNFLGGVSSFDGTNWKQYRDSMLVTGSNFYSITLDSLGRKWVGSQAGAIIIDGNDVSSITTQNGLLSKMVYTVAFDKAGNAWIGTSLGLEEMIGSLSGVSSTNSPNTTLQCSVYPNPMLADAAHLSLSGAESGVYQITLTNTLGIVLKTASVNASGTPTRDLSTSDLASGAYLITIANGAERVTVPVVKE